MPMADALMLVASFTAAVIQGTLMTLLNGKIQGPYIWIYKGVLVAMWSIVGRDFIIAIWFFFQYSLLPTSVNATILVLIPKKNPAQTITDFRPIAVVI